jgi:multisubunit Na+/H+ antiporter MnhF subunit
VNAFVLAAIGMLVAAVPSMAALWRGGTMEALVAYEALCALGIVVLILLAVGFRRSGELELPVLFAVLTLGSGLVFARFLERRL